MSKKKFILPLTVFALLLSFGLAACNGGGDNSENNAGDNSAQQQESQPASEGKPSSAKPEKIVISSPDNKKSIMYGETLQLSASVEGVTWATSKPEVATISETGLVTSISKGSTTISAEKEGYTKATLSITVNYPDIAVTAEGNKTSLLYGETVQLSADKEGVTWTSSDATIASVSDTGLVSALSKGSATIKATKDHHNDGTITINVDYPNITVTAAENKVELQLAETVQLSSDVSGVAWTSSNANVASVSDAGLVTAAGYGKATIKASKEHHNDGEIVITVVRPERTAFLHMEDAEHYSADGEWSSSGRGPITTPVYSKDNASDGTCIAYFGAGDKETVKFTSNKAIKAEICLMIGYYYSIDDLTTVYDVKFNNNVVNFPVQSYESEGTSNYTYKPLSFGELDLIAGTNVLEITMKAPAEGASERYPYMDDLNFYASESLIVTMIQDPQIEVQQNSFSLVVGETAQIQSATTGLSYATSDAAVVTVSDSGLITAVAKGSAEITVSKEGMRSTKVKVAVGETFSGAEMILEAEDAIADEGITYRTPSSSSNASGAVTRAWPANAVLKFEFKSSVAATVDLILRGRANGGSNGYTYTDVNLASDIEIKINGVVVAVAGTVSGSTINDYALGDMNVKVGDNTIEIKCVNIAPTVDYLKLSPKASA